MRRPGETSWSDHSDETPGPLFESYSAPGSGLVRFDLRGLGTQNVILLEGDDTQDLRFLAQEGFDLLARLEGKLSKFQADSDVGLANQLAHISPVFVGPEMSELLLFALEAWKLTGGAFDPTVGPLLEAWGLDDLSGRIPTDAELDEARELCGLDLVEFDSAGGVVSFRKPGVVLDFGGIAKGYIVDRLVELFRGRGIGSGAVISGRSTLAVWGCPPGRESWDIEVSDPEDSGGEALGRFRSDEGVVSSSGASERHFKRDGELFGHVLDPRSGRPVRHLKGATVWTPEALLGDVLSTSLFVLGPDGAEADGPLEKLVANCDGARASLGWVRETQGAWGGQALEWRHIGEPGLR